MAEHNFQDAVQVLQQHLGGRWEGSEADGRDEMVKILKRELNYDTGQANDAIDAMIAAGALRYVAEGAAEVAVGDTPEFPVPAAPLGTGGSQTITAAPLAVAPGYWQVTGGSVVEAEGRKGQVEPT